MKLQALLATVTIAFACGPKAAPVTPPPGGGGGTGTTGPGSPAEAPLPLWSAVRHGVLPNGLAYYVLPHKKPEKRANLWLAVNAGAVQEDDDQRGLAHFVEHMCFNGTKRFPKNDIVNVIERAGVKFGPDLNAFTSFDETVYQLQVPTDDHAILDKGFDILRDWAGDVTFDKGEVERERGVVLEEWRLGRGFQQRLLDKLFPVVFGDSKYAKRLPIGLPEIIQKAPRERLVQFYKDWYRPDLMAVIAVGDFADADAIEKQIKAKFGDLPKAQNPRLKEAPKPPPATGTRIAIETDKELPVTAVGVANMMPHRPLATKSDFRRSLVEQVYQLMLNERLQSIARRPDAPFALAAALIQNITREVDAFARFAVVKGDDAEGALKAVFAEVLRVEKHGFVQAELDRARAVVTREIEQHVTEFPTRESRSITEELLRNFLQKEEVAGPEGERDMALAMLPQITLGELNAVAKSFGGAENRVIVLAGPDGKPLPAKDKVLKLVDEVGKSPIEPWKEGAVITKLMDEPAWPGTVSKETKIDALNALDWTLANGVRVIVKPTDYEKDAVMISAYSPGGLATVPTKDYNQARFAAEIAAIGGVGQLDADALGKALAGKRVQVNAEIDEVAEGIDATGSARDLEVMLQLINLKMTQPRRDEQAFGVWKTNTIDALTKQEANPDAQFQRKYQELLWGGNPRKKLPTAADIKAVDLDKALDIYRARFRDASDFTFVIVGAVDPVALKPLVEAYLGSLPGAGKKEKEIDDGTRKAAGVVKQTLKLGLDQDKARVQLLLHGDEPWTRDKDRDMHILSAILEIRLFEKLREEMSGVYGVGARGFLTRSPRQERTFSVSFGCAPNAVDKLIDATYAEFAKIAKGEVKQDDLDKVKAQFVRERETAMKTNRFWVDWLERSARYGDDPKIILDSAPLLARITSDNVKAAALRFLDKKRLFQIVMLPAAK